MLDASGKGVDMESTSMHRTLESMNTEKQKLVSSASAEMKSVSVVTLTAEKPCLPSSSRQKDSFRNSRGAAGPRGSHFGPRGDIKLKVYDLGNESKSTDNSNYDPMLAVYNRDVGLRGEDPSLAQGGFDFKEGRPQDVPCKYHDGFSGTCWKGNSCVYGHELYTGGRFAQLFPDFAFAAAANRILTPVTRLPLKPSLHNEREITCRITHLESPGEFYIRPTTEGSVCPCSLVDTAIKEKEVARRNDVMKRNDPMDSYFYGFSALEVPEYLCEEVSPLICPDLTLDDKLQIFMNTAFHYTRLQFDTYQPKVELVAARVRNKWMRAYMIFCGDRNNDSHHLLPEVRVQLLDTGEKLNLTVKDVCRLPEHFCNTPAAAFRCALYRVSPVWFQWTPSAIRLLKDLVEDRDVRAIIKDGADEEQRTGTTTFESYPYLVQILVQEEGSTAWVDFTDKLIEEGRALEWNILPYRPFARNTIDTKRLEFLHQTIPDNLSERALDVENRRIRKAMEVLHEVDDGIDLESVEPTTTSFDNTTTVGIFATSSSSNCPENAKEIHVHYLNTLVWTDAQNWENAREVKEVVAEKD